MGVILLPISSGQRACIDRIKYEGITRGTVGKRERLSRTMVGLGDLIITEYLNDDSLRFSYLYTVSGTTPFDPGVFSLD